MKKINPVFLYMSVLAVIQPARVQDIEKHAQQLLPKDQYSHMINRNLFRAAHEVAKASRLVIPVRRGVFCLSQQARGTVRRGGLQQDIDNRRLFLMKEQRKAYR